MVRGLERRRIFNLGACFKIAKKSILCNADNYLLEIARYIHLNPSKANIIKILAELDRYPGTEHAGLFGLYRKQSCLLHCTAPVCFIGET